MNDLRQLVERYLLLAGQFGRAVSLDSFALGAEETARVFSALDEDYQISRYLKFSRQSGAEFSVNGFPQTHVAFEEAILDLL
ncbi:MAG TPA: hypothetical protein VL099_14135 [Candidatus Binatia bacterium]|nr:hypothetical protein [Candidatus Binatia bacterium]